MQSIDWLQDLSSSKGLKQSNDWLQDFISNKVAFTVSVKTDDEVIDRTVLCGEIVVDITGKFFLIAYAREVNTLEIDELLNNFEIDINRIAAVRTSELPWSIFVPSISVKFRLSPQSIQHFRQLWGTA